MKIPKKIKIGGHWYEIILHDRNRAGGSDKLGTTYIFKNKIFLDNTSPQTQQESTLIHEILEVIISFNKLDLSEEKICVLETGLYQVLVDNKLLNL